MAVHLSECGDSSTFSVIPRDEATTLSNAQLTVLTRRRLLLPIDHNSGGMLMRCPAWLILSLCISTELPSLIALETMPFIARKAVPCALLFGKTLLSSSFFRLPAPLKCLVQPSLLVP